MRRLVLLAQTPEAPDPSDIIPEGLTGWDWIWAGIILAVAITLSRLAKHLIQKAVERSGSERVAARLLGRVVGYIVVIGGFIYALRVLDVDVVPLLGALGIGGIALAFALQDTLQNLIAGVFIETRRPFRRGDQIETNELEGTVEDINLRATIMRTFDGRRVILPNSMVISNPIENLTSLGRRRTTLMVGVAYDTDLEAAQRVMLEAVRSTEGVFPAPGAEVYIEQFGESSIDFAVRYWHEPARDNLWRVRDRVAMAVKAALDREGITIPFPQRTLWFPQGLGPQGVDTGEGG